MNSKVVIPPTSLRSNADCVPVTHADLSERELMVFLALGAGKRVTDIGNEIFRSVKTISTYRTRALKKMGMKSNQEITLYCVRNGLIA